MGLLDWWRRRRGEVRASAPRPPTGDDRFRPDPERFVRTERPAQDAVILPAGDGGTETFTSTVVTVNGRAVDPSDPRAAPILAMLRQVGAPGAAPDAEALRQAVEAFTGDQGAGVAAPSAPAPRPGIAARLGELERLRAAGLVTEAEYAEKRKALLAEL